MQSSRTVMKLDSASLNCQAGALKLFETQITCAPECIVKDGLPFNGTKSDILKPILPKCGDEAVKHPLILSKIKRMVNLIYT